MASCALRADQYCILQSNSAVFMRAARVRRYHIDFLIQNILYRASVSFFICTLLYCVLLLLYETKVYTRLKKQITPYIFVFYTTAFYIFVYYSLCVYVRYFY